MRKIKLKQIGDIYSPIRTKKDWNANEIRVRPVAECVTVDEFGDSVKREIQVK